MKQKDTILNIITKKGFYWTTPDTSEEEFVLLDKMQEDGEITTLLKEGIAFENEDWCYIFPGNPSGVHVVIKNSISWLEKI